MQLINKAIPPGKFEVFCHIGDDGSLTSVNIGALKGWLASRGKPFLQKLLLDETGYNYMIENRGIEPQNLGYITTKMLKDPLIFLIEKQYQMIADGSHRYCVAYLLGKKKLPAYFVPEDIWKLFRIAMTEQEARNIVNSPSGRIYNNP